MSLRIHLADELFPVQAFFNAISDSDFFKVLNTFLDGVGCGINDAGCIRPGEGLDPGEEVPQSGAIFYIFDEELWLDDPAIYPYLAMAVAAYIEKHPEDAATARLLLEKASQVLKPEAD